MKTRKLVVNNQKSTAAIWKDETGASVQYSRTTPVERLMERQSAKLLNTALKINKDLEKMKVLVVDVCEDVHTLYMKSKKLDPSKSKGNFTWYNFDRSIKIEVSISEHIEFDDLGITACREKLDEFLSSNIESKTEFIKELVLSAFKTSRGKLDHKKVTSLLRYRSKINNPVFNEALNLLEESIRRPSSKTYFKISAKNDEGKYELINLNFSSI